jgi:hypothetical protein
MRCPGCHTGFEREEERMIRTRFLSTTALAAALGMTLPAIAQSTQGAQERLDSQSSQAATPSKDDKAKSPDTSSMSTPSSPSATTGDALNGAIGSPGGSDRTNTYGTNAATNGASDSTSSSPSTSSSTTDMNPSVGVDANAGIARSDANAGASVKTPK